MGHKARQRFAGNRCNDNHPGKTARSSTRIVSRRKGIHQRIPWLFLNKSDAMSRALL
jgi:hypothetical protein